MTVPEKKPRRLGEAHAPAIAPPVNVDAVRADRLRPFVLHPLRAMFRPVAVAAVAVVAAVSGIVSVVDRAERFMTGDERSLRPRDLREIGLLIGRAGGGENGTRKYQDR